MLLSVGEGKGKRRFEKVKTNIVTLFIIELYLQDLVLPNSEL